jgi:hypothetical protein
MAMAADLLSKTQQTFFSTTGLVSDLVSISMSSGRIKAVPGSSSGSFRTVNFLLGYKF